MRYLPNLISLSRIAGTLLLAWLIYLELINNLGWLLLVLFLTDWLDGFVARQFNWTSKSGAVLDSTADMFLTLVALCSIWVFHPAVLIDHGWVAGSVVALWTLVHCFAVFRYARLASFHTLLGRLGNILWGMFTVSLYFVGVQLWLYYATGAICILGALETLVMVSLIDKWTPNQRGGLVAYLRDHRTK